MSLTNQDLKNIKGLMDITFDEKLDKAIETRMITKEDISHLPTKDDFYGKMDEVMGELKTIRENSDILTHKVYEDHEPRISNLEKKLNLQPTI